MSGQLGKGQLGKFQLGTTGNSNPALQGTIVGDSAWTPATLTVHVALTGAITGASTWASATLSVETAITLTGDILGESTWAPATLTVKTGVGLAGAITGDSTWFASLEIHDALTGTIAGTSAWTNPTLQILLPLGGAIVGDSSWSGTLNPLLSGQVTGESTWSAGLTVQIPLTAEPLGGTSAWSATLGFATPIALSGTLLGESVWIGALYTPGISLVQDPSQQYGIYVAQLADTMDTLVYNGFNSNGIDIVAQTPYNISAYLMTPATSCAATLAVTDLAGTVLYSATWNLTNTWTRYALAIPATNTETTVQVRLSLADSQGIFRATAFMFQKGALLTPWNLSTQELLMPQSISTDLIGQGAVTGANIAYATIQGQNISGGTITGDLIAANTLVASQVIVSGTITGDLIAANTVTASNLAANSVTAQQIAAGAVTANAIAANSISSAAIQAGAITATQIAAGAVTANALSANAVTAGTIDVNALATFNGDIEANTIQTNGTLTVYGNLYLETTGSFSESLYFNFTNGSGIEQYNYMYGYEGISFFGPNGGVPYFQVGDGVNQSSDVTIGGSFYSSEGQNDFTSAYPDYAIGKEKPSGWSPSSFYGMYATAASYALVLNTQDGGLFTQVGGNTTGAQQDNGSGMSYSYGLQSVWYSGFTSGSWSFSRAFSYNPCITIGSNSDATVWYADDTTSSITFDASATASAWFQAAYNIG